MLASLLATFAFALPPQTAPSQEFVDACSRTASAKSYAFEVLMDAERVTAKKTRGARGAGGTGDGGEGGAGRPARDEKPVPVAGEVVEGAPMRLTRGALEAYRNASGLAYSRDKGRSWELFDPDAMTEAARDGSLRGGEPAGGAGEGPAGGQPGGQPVGPGGGAAGGALVPGGIAPSNFRFAQTRHLNEMSTLPIPHVLLASGARTMTDVRREDRDGKVRFVGTLTSESADDLSGAERVRSAKREVTGREAPERTATGTMAIVVGPSGFVERIEIETKVAAAQRGEQVRKIGIDLRGFGATSYKVPDGVAAVLGQ